MYLITMKYNDRVGSDGMSPYRGAICVITGRPWFVTSKVGPDLFGTEEAASQTVSGFPQEDRSFDIVSIEEYVKTMGDYDVPWLAEIKMLCAKPEPVKTPVSALDSMWQDDF